MKIGYSLYESFIKLILKRLKESFPEGTILSVALFGSVARDEARPDSDIDLLIVHQAINFNLVKRFIIGKKSVARS